MLLANAICVGEFRCRRVVRCVWILRSIRRPLPLSLSLFQVSSRRALRADPAFDKIIQTFYPDLDAYEEKEKQFISSGIAESHPIAAAIEEGWRCQVRTHAHSAPSLVSPRRGLVSSCRGLVWA